MIPPCLLPVLLFASVLPTATTSHSAFVHLRANAATEAEFETLLARSADIDDPGFGRRLSRAELHARRFDAAAAPRVLRWLEGMPGLASAELIPETRFVRVMGSQAAIRRLRKLGSDNIAPPAVLAVVMPGLGLGNLRPAPGRWSNSGRHGAAGETAGPTVVPPYLKSYYNVTDSDSCAAGTNVAFWKLLPGNNFSPDDLATFDSQNRLAKANVAIADGVTNSPGTCSSDASSCYEPNLDAQYLTSTAPGCAVTMIDNPAANKTKQNKAADDDDDITVEGRGVQRGPAGAGVGIADGASAAPTTVADWPFGHLASLEPQIISVSYWLAADRLDPSTKASFSELLKEYTSMGFTFVAASGDDGAQGAGGNGSHFEDTAFASPYAVMVGATSWDPYKFPFPPCVEGARAQCPEVAAHCGNLGGISVISSGGGFASMYLRPSYQAEAVMRYLDWATSTGNLPGTGVMNPAGRGYPDVALLGVRYRVMVNKEWVELHGTSASTPVFAGMLAMIADARAVAGKAPLPGHVTPLLYHLAALQPGIFTDVVQGNNLCKRNAASPGGLCENSCCDVAYYATEGWDPVTGLGSPDFGRLKAALLAL